MKVLALLLVILAVPSTAVAAAGIDPREVRAGPRPADPKATLLPQAYPSSRTHNVGLLSLEVTNLGLLGNPFLSIPRANWRGDEYLYLAALWVGAIGGDQAPHVSAANSLEFRPELNPRWLLYESFEGIPNGLRYAPSAPASADDDGDGWVDEDFQDGFDNDGDGLVDEDFAAIGQQMLSGRFRDNTPEALAVAGHIPLDILVRQRTFQWTIDGINEMVGIDWEIVNIGDQQLTDVYLGTYVDPDVGPPDVQEFWLDDLVSPVRIDTTVVLSQTGGLCAVANLDLPAVAAWDAPDNGTTIHGGDAPGVSGMVLLDHTTDPFEVQAPRRVDWVSAQWFHAGQQDTWTDADRYGFLSDGTVSLGANSPDDYRYILSAGPFPRLGPGRSVSLRLAFVIGEGFPGFRRSATAAAIVHRGAYLDADANPMTGIYGKERCLRVLGPGQAITWTDPCDTTAAPIRWTSTQCLWVDQDCNSCTGIDGRETLVNWIGTLAPPYPDTNLDPSLFSGSFPPIAPAGNGQVTLQWDNTSEIWKDPTTGLRIFEGYRIWKVAEWLTPTLLPLQGDWTLLAEFRLNPPSGQGPADPTHLSHVTNTDVVPIGQTEDGAPIYPLGRYQFTDPDVINNNVYFYCVTAFGLTATAVPSAPAATSTELAALPFTEWGWEVIPCQGCGSVPVHLLSFTAERVGNGARIRWSVADATEVTGFRVHREEPGSERVARSELMSATDTSFEFLDPEAPVGPVEYWLEALERTGEPAWFGPVALGARLGWPSHLAVRTPSPNPFTGATEVVYQLPETRRVTAAVYDLRGRRIRVMADVVEGPGEHALRWSGDTDRGDVAGPGVYLLVVQAGADRVTRRVLYLRSGGR